MAGSSQLCIEKLCILFPERAQMSMEAHLLETGNELQYEVECKILLEQKQSSLSDI